MDLEQVARDLPGLSGAELANVLNEAALEAVRRQAVSISSVDVYNAIDRILQVSNGNWAVISCSNGPVECSIAPLYHHTLWMMQYLLISSTVRSICYLL